MNKQEQIVIYQTEDGQTRIDVQLQEDTVWLNQEQLSKLFGHTKQNISLHINNCFREGELEQNSVVKEFLISEK